MKETLTKFYKKMDDHLIQDLCEFSKENLEQKFIQSSGEIVFKFKFKTETGLFFKINELFKKNLSVCSSSFLENKDFITISYYTYYTLQYCYHIIIQKFANGYTTVDIISHKNQISGDDFEKLQTIEAFDGDF